MALRGEEPDNSADQARRGERQASERFAFAFAFVAFAIVPRRRPWEAPRRGGTSRGRRDQHFGHGPAARRLRVERAASLHRFDPVARIQLARRRNVGIREQHVHAARGEPTEQVREPLLRGCAEASRRICREGRGPRHGDVRRIEVHEVAGASREARLPRNRTPEGPRGRALSSRRASCPRRK